ncbi:MAG: UxaA family hydrolase [Pseudomonadota bacterium]
MTARAIAVHEHDSVATALSDLSEGEVVTVGRGTETLPIQLRAPIAFGHKLALDAFQPGDPIVKYGQVIGRATQAIAPGDHVHVHNLEGTRGRGDLT